MILERVVRKPRNYVELAVAIIAKCSVRTSLYNGDVILNRGRTRRGPRSCGRQLAIVPGLYGARKPNLTALRAYRNCCRIKEP